MSMGALDDPSVPACAPGHDHGAHDDGTRGPSLDTGSADRAPRARATALPVLRNRRVTLRQLRAADAAALLAHVSPPDVLRHIAPAPTTMEGMKRFIRWTHAQHRKRSHVAFGVVPAGQSHAVGILQCWPVELDWSTAEWGFIVGQPYWGTGLFDSSARLMLDFAFGTMGVRRLEARSADANGRGNGALRKLGAVREGMLRSAFRQGTVVRDHVMWSILSNEWQAEAHESAC